MSIIKKIIYTSKFIKLFKNIMAAFIIVVSSFAMTASVCASLADWQLPADISPLQIDLPKVELSSEFYFLGEKIEFKNKPYIATGRIYLPLSETVSAFGGEYSEDSYGVNIKLNNSEFYISKQNDDSFPKRFLTVNSQEYISMFSLLENSVYEPVFYSIQNKVEIWYSGDGCVKSSLADGDKHSAYLRLEDIMADGIDPLGYYDDIGLEKLRAISDYLYKNSQKFYIAWIPLYKNPSSNIENSLTKNFNLYNASFLYTLDYLVKNGGKIGIHGYTHQYGNEKSADGYEFDSKMPFSDIECINRMLEAKKVARDLGYEVSFFEFPHYGATSDTLRYAEKYYDVIYQQECSVKSKGYIVDWTRANGKKIKYVPTPADYILNIYDVDNMKARIDNCLNTNQIVSLFYHPRIDFQVMYIKNENNVRTCYVPDNSAVYRIVEKVLSKNLSFNYF